MKNLKVREDIARLIKVWPLEDVKMGTDVFGECLLEAYVQDVIPPHKGKELPLGMFNQNMIEALRNLSTNYHNGTLDLEAAVDEGIKIATNPENYSISK